MTLVNPKPLISLLFIFSLILSACQKDELPEESIPLPEHPRPDFERTNWINLNGYWQFEFDGADEGVKDSWFNEEKGECG